MSQSKGAWKKQSKVCIRVVESETGPTHKENIILGTLTRPSWADQNLPKQPEGLLLCISDKTKQNKKHFHKGTDATSTNHPYSLPTIPHLPVIPGH